ncbi:MULTISPECIES: zinc ribbon domain-containing protein [Xanthomonas]|uniref:Regulatory protein, FmdB family n=1 Tax=Xanthomonas cannabis pv. phaseoli TaxID=1885902 RepID=A0AB34P8R1_9XANT|nr:MULTISPECIES: zinc ribbon domain-containing protein [Xanthomonas]MCC4607467.1 zinc ribbon domain-containing protein [Xanthomonas campestris pv. zinniae]KGK57932.1 regulatory protein, FmdB family [Xanthomonas cannabis pv. phaseoli]MBB3806614.1 putative FmdB family regulatory protein [Xanthomonas cannabis]NIK17896.1 putative FmdB family regulatory protein [Xanthomonas cannabis]PPU36551.1 zinc ribbon domain-containing protein [Xanthomonas sp. CFBP 7912]
MPIYAFQCTTCGHSFDRLQKMADPDPQSCPACAAATIKRQVTAPSFRLSGSGWYETDFKSAGEKKKNLTDSSSAGGEAKPAAAGDSKPAAAPAAAAAKPASGAA